jgi:hypothetical protein
MLVIFSIGANKEIGGETPEDTPLFAATGTPV